MGWSLDSIEKRLGVVERHPEADVLEQTPDVPVQIQIENLQKQITKLMEAYGTEKRISRNFEDQDLNLTSHKNSIVETTSSGQNVADPIAAAEIAGKYSHINTILAHPRPEREKEIASVTIAEEGAQQKKKLDM